MGGSSIDVTGFFITYVVIVGCRACVRSIATNDRRNCYFVQKMSLRVINFHVLMSYLGMMKVWENGERGGEMSLAACVLFTLSGLLIAGNREA